MARHQPPVGRRQYKAAAGHHKIPYTPQKTRTTTLFVAVLATAHRDLDANHYIIRLREAAHKLRTVQKLAKQVGIYGGDDLSSRIATAEAVGSAGAGRSTSQRAYVTDGCTPPLSRCEDALVVEDASVAQARELLASLYEYVGKVSASIVKAENLIRYTQRHRSSYRHHRLRLDGMREDLYEAHRLIDGLHRRYPAIREQQLLP
ncbi:Uncharacterised protein [Mycobacteroides abscessus]|nr:Uncharacterised protein [Mycobacteroides abscessus]CPW34015.1 Uncharacterised protein [Mycobacteroides abscessus]CPZ48353.1 Uncharacterised protein [Mycobacteroides abscessus]